MEEISATKKLKIVRLYLDLGSVREISSQTGVSVGAVSNIIADAKNGKIPQIREPTEQIQMTRDLKADLKTYSVTLEQAVLGATLARRLLEQKIEPSEVGHCLDFWHRTASENQGKDVVQIALRLDAVCQRTGLSPEALAEKVELLENEVARLEPAKRGLAEKQKELQALEKRRAPLAAEIAGGEKERDRLRQDVGRLEGREAELSTRVATLEKRRDDAEEGVAVASSGLKLLAEMGLPPEELPGFAQRIAAVAGKHGMAPGHLRERLVGELEQLDKGLGLDSQIKAKRDELRGVKKSIQNEMETGDRLRSETAELRQNLAAIHGQIAEGQALLAQELQSHVSELKAAGANIQQALSSTSSEVLVELQKMKDQALEVGREIAKYEATIQQNQPMATLATMLSSQEDVRPQDAQFVSLWVLRRLRDWGHKEERLTIGLGLFVSHLESVITDLENWRPR